MAVDYAGALLYRLTRHDHILAMHGEGRRLRYSRGEATSQTLVGSDEG